MVWSIWKQNSRTKLLLSSVKIQNKILSTLPSTFVKQKRLCTLSKSKVLQKNVELQQKCARRRHLSLTFTRGATSRCFWQNPNTKMYRICPSKISRNVKFQRVYFYSFFDLIDFGWWRHGWRVGFVSFGWFFFVCLVIFIDERCSRNEEKKVNENYLSMFVLYWARGAPDGARRPEESDLATQSWAAEGKGGCAYESRQEMELKIA